MNLGMVSRWLACLAYGGAKAGAALKLSDVGVTPALARRWRSVRDAGGFSRACAEAGGCGRWAKRPPQRLTRSGRFDAVAEEPGLYTRRRLRGRADESAELY